MVFLPCWVKLTYTDDRKVYVCRKKVDFRASGEYRTTGIKSINRSTKTTTVQSNLGPQIRPIRLGQNKLR